MTTSASSATSAGGRTSRRSTRLRAQWGSPKIKTDLTYASQVNRVFGPDSPQGKWEGDVVLANFAYTLPVGTLTLFDYYLDIDGVASASSNTVGVKLAGSKPIGKLTGTYALAYAQQAEAGANAADRRRRLRARRRRPHLREVRRCAWARASRRRRRRRRSRRRSRRCTRSKAGPTSSSRRRPPASRTRTFASAIRSASAGAFTNLAAVAVFHDYDADFGSAHFGEELNLQFVARTERMALTAKLRRLPRGRLVHRYRKALALRRLLVLTVASPAVHATGCPESARQRPRFAL